MSPPRSTQSRRGLTVRSGGSAAMTRSLPEETAVALVYNGATQAVMMASPQDLEDFAVGFSLTEGIIAAADEIEDLEIVPHGTGIEARIWLGRDRAEALGRRRRAMAGPVGCGLCGIESLDEALRPIAPLPDGTVALAPADVDGAVIALAEAQPLRTQTRATHAAGFWVPGTGLMLVREDVGRHNALDKLIGALARGRFEGSSGAIVVTSRVSVELVQKTAAADCPVLIAVSAPTSHAVRLAEDANLTLVANARGDGFDIFAHPGRIDSGARFHVA